MKAEPKVRSSANSISNLCADKRKKFHCKYFWMKNYNFSNYTPTPLGVIINYSVILCDIDV